MKALIGKKIGMTMIFKDGYLFSTKEIMLIFPEKLREKVFKVRLKDGILVVMTKLTVQNFQGTDQLACTRNPLKY